MAKLSPWHFYVARHWRGELPLWQSFWVNWLLGGLICSLVLVAVLVFAEERVLQAGAAAALLAYAIWSIVGTWRAALRYPGPRAWSVLARAAIVMNFVSNVADRSLAIYVALWLALVGAAVIVWLMLHFNRLSSQGGSRPAS